jgi:antitoxin component YwqK of YwqJK toxin-antitoxin module
MMKKSLLILFTALFISFPAIAQDTITKYYNDEWQWLPNSSNASYYRKMFKNQDDVWIVNDFYVSGKIQMSSAFYSVRIDRYNGPTTYYFENGNKSSEGEYVKGELEGEWCFWYENGQLERKGTFLKSKRIDTWEGWYENGNKRFYKEYDKKGRVGKQLFYYESGEIMEENTPIGKSLYLCKGFYKNGNIKYEGGILNDDKTGHWKYFNSDGRLTSEGNMKQGYKNGTWIRYFPSGEQIDLRYVSGQRIGEEYGGLVRKTD